MDDCVPTFSVVIPTLNEAETLRRCIHGVRKQHHDAEIIVVDGGSKDDTVAIARAENVTVLTSCPGRGMQCNVGASRASGDILVFLHADTLLPETGFDTLRRAFENPEVTLGMFRLGFDVPHWILKAYTFFTRFDSVFTKFGDQCIVVRASFFRECGGFPDWPLFEDVQFLRKARRKAKVHCFQAAVITSARRFLANGIIRQQVVNACLLFLFLLGASPHRLARSYAENAPKL